MDADAINWKGGSRGFNHDRGAPGPDFQTRESKTSLSTELTSPQNPHVVSTNYPAAAVAMWKWETASLFSTFT
jgi:hypothetical protein